ncbi:MAG: hypothetical protein ACHBN1_10375 [Heteroscytonema crispum UTEX LB 1556]
MTIFENRQVYLESYIEGATGVGDEGDWGDGCGGQGGQGGKVKALYPNRILDFG